MAVMASASIVVTYRAEARGVTTFWTSKPSTAATPAAPTTTSTDAYVADWSTTMPAYDSSLRCYRVDRVERSDGTCSWGEVTEDQSWAGANSANGTATDAQQVAESAADQAGKASDDAAEARGAAEDAQKTADELSTLVRLSDGGVAVGQSADGSTWATGRSVTREDGLHVLDRDGTQQAQFGEDTVIGTKAPGTPYFEVTKDRIQLAAGTDDAADSNAPKAIDATVSPAPSDSIWTVAVAASTVSAAIGDATESWQPVAALAWSALSSLSWPGANARALGLPDWAARLASDSSTEVAVASLGRLAAWPRRVTDPKGAEVPEGEESSDRATLSVPDETGYATDAVLFSPSYLAASSLDGTQEVTCSTTRSDVAFDVRMCVDGDDGAFEVTGQAATFRVPVSGPLAAAYPVGSLYFNASNSANPRTLLGFGTWQRFGEGRMLLSASDSHEAGATGGAETVTLTTDQMPGHTHTATTSSAGAHTHTATTSSAGAHTHNTMAHKSGNEVTGYGLTKSLAFVDRPMVEGNNNRPLWTSSNGAHSHSLTTASAGAHTHTLTTASTGGGDAHDNMPPWISVYIWVRTA